MGTPTRINFAQRSFLKSWLKFIVYFENICRNSCFRHFYITFCNCYRSAVEYTCIMLERCKAKAQHRTVLIKLASKRASLHFSNIESKLKRPLIICICSSCGWRSDACLRYFETLSSQKGITSMWRILSPVMMSI